MEHSPDVLASLAVGAEVRLCPTNTSVSKPRRAVVVRHTATLIFVKAEDRNSEEAFRLSDGRHHAKYLRDQFPSWQVRPIAV